MNTEIFTQINWYAILVATFAYFVLGALWYSKILFGTKWAKLINLDTGHPDAHKGMGKMMIGSFFLMLVSVIGLAILVVKFDFGDNYFYGIELGLLTGICLASSAVGINYIYENKPFGLLLINNGYHVFGHVIASTILVLWR